MLVHTGTNNERREGSHNSYSWEIATHTQEDKASEGWSDDPIINFAHVWSSSQC